MDFRHWAIIIILRLPAFAPQVLKDFGTALNKLEEICIKNTKKPFLFDLSYLQWSIPVLMVS